MRHEPLTQIRRDATEYIEDAWYAIARARAVPRRRPLALRRFGRALALFRGADGTITAVDAACPHRGADLAAGRVVDGALQCPYHGFRFAADGRCVAVPCEGRSFRISDELSVRTYPVREAHGLVWLWWGAPREEYPELFWPPGMPDGEGRGTATGELEWDVSLPLVVESNLDIHHTPFAHRRVTPGVGHRLDPYEARLDGDIVYSSGTLRRDDERSWDGRSGLGITLNCKFPALIFGEFRGGRLLVAMAPIDERRTALVFRYALATPMIGGLLARLAVWTEQRFVQPDDLAQQRAAARSGLPLHACRFVPSDRAIVLWYSLYRRRLAAQREARAERAAAE
ncbi:Rieske 2Fe-2S domain-containing protein [Nannocystis sp. SCPEA4]|uniref:Rieske 2Fe-2S domain-containing protein n=1 Tax=Nannocystis sp. SCPEA4 TaxID=2996787 RepID=UPI00226FF5D6|nr:Rieske 2Fe-2S domain-containing protein [Nannocystis sp. SCPEA4]MCY1056952.1 Rieske 2Fe-2S domain-containing protein [Nannocystis sp. SCPEA4]